VQQFRIQQKASTSELTLSATLAAVYVVSTFIPLTPFIGGPAFITAEIVMLPLVAALLRPVLAGATITVGSLGMALFRTSIYTAFGPLGLLVPIIATILGSMAFHYRIGLAAPWAYVLAGSIYYLLFSKGGTLLWLAPYIAVIISLPAAYKTSGTVRTGFLAFYTAMCEQVTLNVLSISVLGLVGDIWTVITPFMYSERAIATLGGAVLIVALKSRLGGRLETSLKSLGR